MGQATHKYDSQEAFEKNLLREFIKRYPGLKKWVRPEALRDNHDITSIPDNSEPEFRFFKNYTLLEGCVKKVLGGRFSNKALIMSKSLTVVEDPESENDDTYLIVSREFAAQESLKVKM